MDRYQVGSEYGLDCHCETFAEAIIAAVRVARRNNCEAWIFDRLAHYGRTEEWRVSEDGAVVACTTRKKRA